MDTLTPRELWRRFEPLHAVTYFAPEAEEAYAAAGLQGFWMGYFAGRAAPLGPVPAAVVDATFFNFAPGPAARAIPLAWERASPARVLDARLIGATLALRRLLGDGERTAVHRAVTLARGTLAGLDVAGRPLAAANAALPWPDDPLAQLWQAVTVLREHRGDGHVAALVHAGLDGCQAHVLLIAAGATTRAVVQPARGWSDQAWKVAESALGDRGLLEGSGQLTVAGAELHRDIERATDRLAMAPWRVLGEERTTELARLLGRFADVVAGSGLIPPVNPMGLPIRH